MEGATGSLQTFADSVESGCYKVTSSKSATKVYFVDEIPVYPQTHPEGIFYVVSTAKWPKKKSSRVFRT